MNLALADSGPDSGAISLTLMIEAADGSLRALPTRGLVAYTPPKNTGLLTPSEWNCWTDTPDLDEGERVSEVSTSVPALRWVVLYNERTAGPLYGAGGSDLTRYQMTLPPGAVPADFDASDFDVRDFA